MHEDSFGPEFLEQHYLGIVLDEPSRATVSALAKFNDVRAHHVTLAYPREGDRFSPDWIPFGHRIGECVEVNTVSMHESSGIQVLLVTINGSSFRPFDAKKLHITVSKQVDVKSNSANDVLEETCGAPLLLTLWGTVRWIGKAL